MAGGIMKLSVLYPPIEFPVSRSTPMISPAVKWQHEDEWEISNSDYNSDFYPITEKNFLINPDHNDNIFLKDHVIDGKNLYPGFGYLVCVLNILNLGTRIRCKLDLTLLI